MAQPQRNINIPAPGFLGINTQDAPISVPVEYAAEAENCVIDKEGRIGARKGFVQQTTNPDVLGGNPIISTQEFTAEDGTKYLFATGNNTIYLHDTVAPYELNALTLPGGYVITGDNWQIIPFNNKCFFVQEGHEMLVFRHADGLSELFAVPIPGITSFPHCATAGAGHLFVGDFDDDESIIFWSALLDGEDFAGAGTGSVDVTDVWPSGFDEIRAIKIHNNFLVIFGKRSIVLYSIPKGEQGNVGPAYMSLADTVEGIGCISRDTVQELGLDVWFLDATGIRSLGRTIQEKSVPIGDLSRNVRSDLKQVISTQDDKFIKSVYHPEDSIYAIFFPGNPVTYVFDTRQLDQNQAARVTTWTQLKPRCAGRSVLRSTWFGGEYGLYIYTGYTDEYKETDAGELQEVSIPLRYSTHPLVFGDPSVLKFPKQVDVTVFGGAETELCLDWFYDYSGTPKQLCKIIPGIFNIANYFNGDEFATGVNFGKGSGSIGKLKYNIWGSGNNISLSFTADIQDAPLSFQELNIQALQGRIL